MSKSNEPTYKRLRLMDNINEPSSSSSLGDQKTEDRQPDSSQVVEEQRNSLLGLNDDCLRDIFDHLDKDTLCQLADVSTRVRLIAENAFTKRYTNFYQYGSSHKSDASFRRTICKFGKLLTSIDSEKDYCSQEEINAIVKYCPNLKFFRILIKDDLELVANSFPKLVELVSEVSCPIQTFCNLISLSPQLKRLKITGNISDDHITAIIQHTKHLEQLTITSCYIRFPAKLTKESLMQLTELKKLKRFHYIMYRCGEIDEFRCGEIDIVAPLMTAFPKENVNLDYLRLESFTLDSREVKSISNLKELEYLYLDYIICFSDDIISLVRELPKLRTIGLGYTYHLYSVIDLINIVKAGKQLHTVEIEYAREFKINQKVFKELLEAASNRLNQGTLNIDLKGWNIVVDVPHDIQDANRHKLQIKFQNRKGVYAEGGNVNIIRFWRPV